MHSTPLDRGRISLLPVDGGEVVLSSLPAHRMARHGVVKSNQVIMDFDKLTVWDSLLLAVAEADVAKAKLGRAVGERDALKARVVKLEAILAEYLKATPAASMFSFVPGALRARAKVALEKK
jgi:ABC-type branched-subunit amino acid transport system ATPase component